MSKQFPAHIRIDGETETVQTVQEHCRCTADIAGKALAEIHLGSAAYLSGLLHDAGKFTEAFREYLEKSVHGEGPPRGSVNHTFTGVRYLLRRYHTSKSEDDLAPLVAELLSYGVGAHHSLFDCVDEHGHSGFQHRLDKPDIHYEEAIGNFLAQCADEQELDRLFAEAVQELTPILISLCDLAQQNDAYDGEVSFYLGLLARLLVSAVIEGDRQNTASFMNDAEFPDLPEDRRSLWRDCLAQVEQKLGKLSSDSAINRARQTISEQCRANAELSRGIYRLNVPTGGGKTLASLRYALAHAAKQNSSRLIFTSPLLSILDQNAKILRDYIQDDSLILEHHSNLVRSPDAQDAIVNGVDPELLTENWRAPIIITTLVQLLNTCFSGKTSCIRRFQALVNSVIVIDEVQTAPPRMLTLFNLTITFLSQICGATVVLCSATQPCLEQTDHPVIVPIEDLVPHDPDLWSVFRRTTILDAGSRRLEEIPDFALEQLERVNSLLIVCNKKQEAKYLYDQLTGPGRRCFHLSASMCMAHRRNTLDDIEKALDQKGKTVCVATQVIEAGVDISFDCVIRLAAGLDSVIQSAGRCNRNGDAPEPAPVYLLQCEDEDLRKLPDIQNAKTATISLLAQFRQRPEDFQADLSSDEAVGYYYRRLYQEMPPKFQDFTVIEKGKGKSSLYSLLSLNEDYLREDTGFALNQAFQEAGALFQVFDDKTQDVLVPYGEGAEVIADLCSERANRDASFLQSCLERAKPYTISLFDNQVQYLKDDQHAVCGDKVLMLQPQFYDEHTGLLLEGTQGNANWG
jgi:CRISPR-associated endonuclease/helicase Cas3